MASGKYEKRGAATKNFVKAASQRFAPDKRSIFFWKSAASSTIRAAIAKNASLLALDAPQS
jgi:hypothetical protein